MKALVLGKTGDLWAYKMLVIIHEYWIAKILTFLQGFDINICTMKI